MTRCLGLSIIVLLIAQGSTAQDMLPQGESPFTKSTHERFHGGIRGGPGVTWASPAEGSLLGGQSFSWAIGAVGLLKLSRRYQLEAGFSYQRVGSVLNDIPTQQENKMNLDMVTSSAAIRRNSIFGGALADMYVSVGPSLSYWMGGRGTWKTPGTETNYSIEFTQSVDSASAAFQAIGANRWLLGVNVGLGVGLPIARRQKIFLEAGGTLGITRLGSNGSACYFAEPGFSSGFASELLLQRLSTVWLTASYTFVYNTMESRLGRSTTDKKIKRSNSSKQKKDKTDLNTRIKSKKKKP